VRVYVGERDEERTWVRVVERRPTPEVSEVVEVLAELQGLHDDRQGWSVDQSDEYKRRRAEYLARKDDLVARIRAAEEQPDPVDLVHRWTGAADLFDWSNRSAGATALARSILTRELDQRVPASVFRRFRDEVVAGLPQSGFELESAAVWRWIGANRELVDQELFLTPPSPASDLPAPVLTVEDSVANDPASEVQDAATASALVRACEQAWDDIRVHHPDLPDAVMVLGTGVERGRLVKLGHWWGGRWLADGDVRGEVLLAGEALHLPPAQVFEVLLHEAAHGLNAARGIKDTSRGGRYHNQRFAAAAHEVLLDVKAMPPYGLASTSLSSEGEYRYAGTVERLGDAMRIVRQLERSAGLGEGSGAEGGNGKTGGEAESGDEAAGRSRGSVASSCGCGRRMRMAPSVLAAGPVVCGICDAEFTPDASRAGRAEVERGAAGAVVDDTFVDRRRSQVASAEPAATGLHPAGTAELDRRREMLDAALFESGESDDPRLRPLRERKERLDAVVGDESPWRPAPSPATPGQVEGLKELASLPRSDEDSRAVGEWYERFGTYEEQPMAPSGPFDEGDRGAMARALLKADGSLTGPAVIINGAEVMAGDRVTAAADRATGVEEGMPGTVRKVDTEQGTVEIDFATWGRLQASLSEAVVQSLRHDYVVPVEAGPAVPDPRRLDLELQRITPEVEP
jgi:hypothetical protein